MAGAMIPALVADLAAEAADLSQVLADAPEEAWATATPAVGWAVRDQVAHLAHFDWVTRTAITDPDDFVALRDGLPDLQPYVDSIGPANRSRDGADLLRWWRDQNARLCAAARSARPGIRIPWFGPPMSLASKVTARIMETWAHGQDVVDALGVRREPTDRLAHVVRIGALALPNSFRVNGRAVPETPVRVSVTLPSGAPLAFGPDDATDTVTGSALDFALVVTQRRHVADTRLSADGPIATQWLQIAQAFAGPPGAGRAAGQFAKEGAR